MPFSPTSIGDSQDGAACGKVEGANPLALSKRLHEFSTSIIPSEDTNSGGFDKLAGSLRAKLEKLIR